MNYMERGKTQEAGNKIFPWWVGEAADKEDREAGQATMELIPPAQPSPGRRAAWSSQYGDLCISLHTTVTDTVYIGLRIKVDHDTSQLKCTKNSVYCLFIYNGFPSS